MFSISDQLTKIVSTTPVSEKHGKDRVSALSIGLYVVMPSTALDHFDPALRPSIWRKPMPRPGGLPLESEELTELRFPFMRDYAWSRKYSGYLLRVHIGATGADDVLLGDCGIKDIRFVAQEGGSVGIGFKVTAHPKDEHDLGKICTRLQQEVIVTLTPPDKPVDLFSGSEEEQDDSERDPFESSDLAQDETRIPSEPEKKRTRRATTH